MSLNDFIPFLIPLIIVQFGLLFFTLRHILIHSHYKHGSRRLWIIITIIGMEFIGPILYFVFGKEDD